MHVSLIFFLISSTSAIQTCLHQESTNIITEPDEQFHVNGVRTDFSSGNDIGVNIGTYFFEFDDDANSGTEGQWTNFGVSPQNILLNPHGGTAVATGPTLLNTVDVGWGPTPIYNGNPIILTISSGFDSAVVLYTSHGGYLWSKMYFNESCPIKAVPEPSAFLYIGLVGVGLVGLKKLKRSKTH